MINTPPWKLARWCEPVLGSLRLNCLHG